MNLTKYISVAAAVLLMGLSWYAYSTTKALGASELQNELLTSSLEKSEERLTLLSQAIALNRKQHEKVERTLRRRIGELSRVETQACFDDPIPDTAADIVRQLRISPGVPAAPGGADSPDSNP